MTTRKVLGSTYVINGKAISTDGFPDTVPTDIYYEVVRLIGRKVLFLEDHLQRLKRSLEGSGLDYPGDGAIIRNLRILLENNDFTEGNIRICLQPGNQRNPDLLSYFISYYYPEECTYLSGVQLVTHKHERPNPGVKKWDNDFRVAVAETIREYGVYEVILINGKDEITEGSRSNVFFIDKNGQVVSPPENCILPGITRKYVLNICRQEKIPVIEKTIPRSTLVEMESCFISGTSPKVLPVWQLDSHQFRVDHPLLKTLMEQFDKVLQQNLRTIV